MTKARNAETEVAETDFLKNVHLHLSSIFCQQNVIFNEEVMLFIVSCLMKSVAKNADLKKFEKSWNFGKSLNFLELMKKVRYGL